MTTGSEPSLARLSVPVVRRKPTRPISDDELILLRRVGSVLIPDGHGRPGVCDLAAFDELAHEAVAIVDPELQLLSGLVMRLASSTDHELEDELRRMSDEDPGSFYPLSLIITGIFVYSDEVIEKVGYPLPHRNAPPSDQVADELMSGVLDPVVERGSIYRRVE